MQFIWTAFSLIFHAPLILCVSKLSTQEYEDESQKYSKLKKGKAIYFLMLSVLSTLQFSSCFHSGLIFVGTSKFAILYKGYYFVIFQITVKEKPKYCSSYEKTIVPMPFAKHLMVGLLSTSKAKTEVLSSS